MNRATSTGGATGRCHASQCSPSLSPLALQAVRHLQASIKYEAGDLRGCRAALEALPPGSAAATTAGGCIAYKEGQYAEAAAQFGEAAQMAGYPPELAYAVAVCQYQQRDYAGGATVVLRVDSLKRVLACVPRMVP